MFMSHLRNDLREKKEVWLELKDTEEMDDMSSLDDDSDSSDESSDDDSDSDTEPEPRRNVRVFSAPPSLLTMQLPNKINGGSNVQLIRHLPDLQRSQSSHRWAAVPHPTTPTHLKKIPVDRPPTSLPRMSAPDLTAQRQQQATDTGNTANARWTSTIRSNRSSSKLSFDILKNHNPKRTSFSSMLSNPDLARSVQRAGSNVQQPQRRSLPPPSTGSFSSNTRWTSQVASSSSTPNLVPKRSAPDLLSKMQASVQARGGNAQWASKNNRPSSKVSPELLRALGSSLRKDGSFHLTRELDTRKATGGLSRWDAGSSTSLSTGNWSTMPRRPSRRNAIKKEMPEQELRQLEHQVPKSQDDDEDIQDVSEVTPPGSTSTSGSGRSGGSGGSRGSAFSFSFSQQPDRNHPPTAPSRRRSLELTSFEDLNIGVSRKEPPNRTPSGRHLPERGVGAIVRRPMPAKSNTIDLADVDLSSPKRRADCPLSKPKRKMHRSEEYTSNVCIKLVEERR